MKHACVRFLSEADAARALHGLMQRGKVSGLRDGSFIVPLPALDWLREREICFTLVRELNQDDVVQALRDHLAETV